MIHSSRRMCYARWEGYRASLQRWKNLNMTQSCVKHCVTPGRWFSLTLGLLLRRM